MAPLRIATLEQSPHNDGMTDRGWTHRGSSGAACVAPTSAIEPIEHQSVPEGSGQRGRWIVFIAMAWAALIVAVGETGSSEGAAPSTASVALAPLSTLEDIWIPSTPEEQGINPGKLADLVERAVATGWIDSVSVVRNGAVVLDSVIFPFPEGAGHSVGPSTHSVLGTLVGIMIDRGLLPGVDTSVADILAKDSQQRAPAIDPSLTVEHLLTMSLGGCADTSEDLLRSIARSPSKLGAQFEYCDRASFLLSATVSAGAGMSVEDFATETLFTPLGITEVSWPRSSDGVFEGSGELVLLPLDLARIGHLYLQGGTWDGRRIVSPEWIEASTTPHIETDDSVQSLYGYGWYIYSGFVMSNRGDQSIVIVPELDLVVVFTSGLPPTRDYMPETLITQYVLAAIRPNPIPVDTGEQARLDATVAAARSGPEPVGFGAPDVAEAISDARFVFRSPEDNNAWFRICFNDGTATLQQGRGPSGALPFALDDSNEQTAIDIGMQGRFLVDETRQPRAAWRGSWRDNATLAIDYQIIGDARRGTVLFTFEDDSARLQLRNTTAGTVYESIADRAES